MQFMVLGEEEGMPVTEVKGSYAGAMGLGQFMPSSYREYAVDLDGDGRRDLWSSLDDIIGSVANYLHRHGWQYGAPIAVPASRDQNADPALIAERNFKPEKAGQRTNAGGLRCRGGSRPCHAGRRARSRRVGRRAAVAGIRQFLCHHAV